MCYLLDSLSFFLVYASSGPVPAESIVWNEKMKYERVTLAQTYCYLQYGYGAQSAPGDVGSDTQTATTDSSTATTPTTNDFIVSEQSAWITVQYSVVK